MSAKKQIVSNLTKNVIAFQHNLFLLKGEENNPVIAATIQAELMNLGFMLSEETLKNLASVSETEAVGFYQEVVDRIKTLLGDGRYNPLYAGFPAQVMETSDAELFFNAMLHYYSDGAFIPNGYTKKRPEAFERVSYKKINVGTEEQFVQIFTDLLSVNQSLTPTDQETLYWFAQNYPREELLKRVPEKMPFKENLCWAAVELNVFPEKMTTTDALRIIVAYSGGDYLLTSRADKIKRFNRAQRREILSMLETIGLNAEEMKKYEKRWVRIGEILHPGDFAQRFPRVFAAFQKLRNEKIRTWNSRVDMAPSLESKLDLLAQRPGEFARRLGALLRVGTLAQHDHLVQMKQQRQEFRQDKKRKAQLRQQWLKSEKRAQEKQGVAEIEPQENIRLRKPEERLALFPGKVCGQLRETLLAMFQKEYDEMHAQQNHMFAVRAMHKAARRIVQSGVLNEEVINPNKENE